jgi:hypothetical protein
MKRYFVLAGRLPFRHRVVMTFNSDEKAASFIAAHYTVEDIRDHNIHVVAESRHRPLKAKLTLSF